MRLFKVNSEQRIAEGIRKGDNTAMRDFYALFADYLSAICARYVTDDDDIKDVIQDSMISIITHIDSFDYRGEGSLKAWATRIVINQALNFVQQQKKRNTMVTDQDLKDDTPDEDPDVEGIPPDVLLEMIRQLSDGYRMVFNLYVMEGKSHKEIAQLLGIKEDSSASQLHRAKNILARKIKEYRKKHYE